MRGTVSGHAARLGVALVLALAGADASSAAVPTFSTRQVISTTVGLAIDVRTADLDGDGDTDILLASYNGGIFWFENGGGSPPSWTQHHLVTQPGVDGAFSVFAARVDGDADLDLLSASFNDQQYLWYENRLPSSTWPARAIHIGAQEAEDVWAADLDGDGDTDVIAGSTTDQWLAWFENDGASPPAFRNMHTLSTGDSAVTMQAADLDGDSDLDVVTGSRWYESDGGAPPVFTPRLYDTGAPTGAVFVTDVDGDGDADILGASGADNRVAWYENDGGSPPAWTARVITAGAELALAVHGADIDRDGDLDVLSASWQDNTIAWYENDGVSPPAWTEHVITTSATLARSVYAADVDGDGDADVLSATWGMLTLHVNDAAQPSCEDDQECRDTLFCNGVESCGSDDACEPGIPPCTPADFCNEAEDRCVDCVISSHCSDGLFCNGPEICGADGTCRPGTSPCTHRCRESDDRCVICLTTSDCVDDGLFCNGTPSCTQAGNCAPGPAPCAPGTCNEATDSCGAPTAAGELWVSFTDAVVVPNGVGTVQNEDIVARSAASGQWSLLFDGSDVGLSGAAIGGMARLPDGHLLLSFTAPFNVPGLTGGPNGTSVDDSDVVRFTPTSLGANTAGSFSFHFDGSDVGLTTSNEVIDAIDIAPDGRLVVSTVGTASASGANGEDEDLLIFTASSLGSATAGSFVVRFDGGDVGLSSSDEDVDAACDTAAGTLLLSTTGSFNVSGASGADEDVLRFTPVSLGSSTSGSYGIFLDTSTEGIVTSADVSAVEFEE
jgi:hypothetical protein